MHFATFSWIKIYLEYLLILHFEILLMMIVDVLVKIHLQLLTYILVVMLMWLSMLRLMTISCSWLVIVHLRILAILIVAVIFTSIQLVLTTMIWCTRLQVINWVHIECGHHLISALVVEEGLSINVVNTIVKHHATEWLSLEHEWVLVRVDIILLEEWACSLLTRTELMLLSDE